MGETHPVGSAAPALRRELHYGSRVLACFAERPPNVDAMFRDAAARAPQAVALVEEGREATYAALEARVARIAANLATRGIGRGERVGLLLENRAEFVEALLACARLGAVAVPMNVRQRRPETEHMLRHSGAAALVHEAALAEHVPAPGDVPELRHRFAVAGETPGSAPWEELLRPAPAPPPVEVAEDDPFCLLFTSGTTGRPKGAVLTHLGVVHSCLNFQHGLGLAEGERAILAVPASHVTGIIAIILSMVRVAGRVALMRAFKARSFLALAAAQRMTYTLIVPAMYNLCLLDPEFARHDLSAWRVGGFGGAPMPEATVRALAERLPGLRLANAYGATETTSPVTLMPPGAALARLDSVGRALPGAAICVMDEAGREVPPGEAGELWIAGTMVVPGYWRQQEADAISFTGGWWRSGDIGSVDAEGFVRVFDRKKDMVNRGGYKVYPAEVESVLSLHPGVVEAAVVGRPDPVLGERTCAFVVRRDPALTAEALRAFCAGRLSDYKVPDTIRFLDAPLPRNANGKLQKAELRAQAQAPAALEG